MNVDEFELEREPGGPIDMLEHYFSAHGWACERGEDEIVANFQGSWAQYELRAVWRDEDHVLQFLALPDIRVAQDKRAAVYETIGLINEQLWIGHFELWASSGLVLFRHATLLEGEEGGVAHPPACRDPGRGGDRGMRALLPGLPVRPVGRQDPPGSDRRGADRDPGRGVGSIRLRRDSKGPMRAIEDPSNALARGLASIRSQFQIPATFPAGGARRGGGRGEARPGRACGSHRAAVRDPRPGLVDRSRPGLRDRARAASDLLLHYAIADVAWFVDDGDAIDAEAWRRGTTQYLPDGKAGLYPPVLSEGAASLLPDGPRPAVVFTVRVAAGRRSPARRGGAGDHPEPGQARLRQGRERRSAARLRRAGAPDPGRRGEARARRGSIRRPRSSSPSADGRYRAALPAAARIGDSQRRAVAGDEPRRRRPAPGPPDRAVPGHGRAGRPGGAAASPHGEGPRPRNGRPRASLAELERSLDPADPRQATFMLAIQRAGQGASYVPFRAGEMPWHAAVAATYAHATAPLRRLADRYVVRAALAIANGRPVPAAVADAFERLPEVMARADALGARIERAAIDLAEAVILQGREGETFEAVATEVDHRGVRIQLRDLPVVGAGGGRGGQARGEPAGDARQGRSGAADGRLPSGPADGAQHDDAHPPRPALPDRLRQHGRGDARRLARRRRRPAPDHRRPARAAAPPAPGIRTLTALPEDEVPALVLLGVKPQKLAEVAPAARAGPGARDDPRLDPRRDRPWPPCAAASRRRARSSRPCPTCRSASARA